jgi:hypothetical protein
MTKKYFSNLLKSYQKGDAREESYYKHLADFISDISDLQRKRKLM